MIVGHLSYNLKINKKNYKTPTFVQTVDKHETQYENNDPDHSENLNVLLCRPSH